MHSEKPTQAVPTAASSKAILREVIPKKGQTSPASIIRQRVTKPALC